jgi:hypothetical protein
MSDKCSSGKGTRVTALELQSKAENSLETAIMKVKYMNDKISCLVVRIEGGGGTAVANVHCRNRK